MISAKWANTKTHMTIQQKKMAFNASNDSVFKDLETAIKQAANEGKFNITFELTKYQQNNVEFIIEELEEQGYYVQLNDKNHLYISWK